MHIYSSAELFENELYLIPYRSVIYIAKEKDDIYIYLKTGRVLAPPWKHGGETFYKSFFDYLKGSGKPNTEIEAPEFDLNTEGYRPSKKG